MSFDLVMVLMTFAFAVYMGWSVTRALRAGRWGRGEHAIERAAEPVGFWFNICLFSILAAVTLFDSLRVWQVEGSAHVPVGALLMAGLASIALAKALRTGEALDPLFSRHHEPIQYWFIVAALIAIIAIEVWIVLV